MSKPVKNLLKQIGKRDEIASECGVAPIAVYRWGESGCIPSKHLPGVLRVAERNNAGIEADALIAAHDVSPSSDVSQIDGSLPSKDVGSGNANVKGAA
jgi:hypothetical protein